MQERDVLTQIFEEQRSRLRGVAYRMLGSASEADDAVQEAWLKVGRADTSGVENLAGWLTTVVARVCLDMLRSRKARREDAFGTQLPEPVTHSADGSNPEQEALLADSVGLALLVVLDTLTPAERLAFVLHDMFALPFEEIAGIVGRSPAATRQLASRGRRRVQGAPAVPGPELARQRAVVDAFLAALRAGDFAGLVAVLDPDVVFRADAASAASGGPTEVRGAETWARGAISFARGARYAEAALVNGSVGLILAPRGRLLRVLTFSIVDGKITQAEVIGEPERLRQFDLAVLGGR